MACFSRSILFANSCNLAFAFAELRGDIRVLQLEVVKIGLGLNQPSLTLKNAAVCLPKRFDAIAVSQDCLELF